MHGEIDLVAVHCGEAVGEDVIVARTERKEIGRFGVRIVPFGKMTPIAKIAGCPRRAIGQEIGELGLLALDADMKAAHHIRPVWPVGDAAEPVGLALGTEPPAGNIEPGQDGVLRRLVYHGEFQLERVRHILKHQGLV